MTKPAIMGRVLFAGTARGPLLNLSAPLSFWGGIDPKTGDIILGSHPERGRNVKGTILSLPEPIGSSSSSYVMLELIHNGVAPAALLLGQPDAILIVGCLVARELGYKAPPIIHVERSQLDALSGSDFQVIEEKIEVLG
jgi:predicted aconitase with swiveling domain